MTISDRLDDIKRILEEFEHSAAQHNYAGGAAGLIERLSPSLLPWEARRQFFEQITSELNTVSRTERRRKELVASSLELQGKADKAKYLLNLVIDDVKMPHNATDDTIRKARDASIRYVGEPEHLGSSPLIYDTLIRLAIRRRELDMETRRLAWLYVCKQRAEHRFAPKGEAGEIDEGVELEDLRRIRERSLSERSTLGPRGSLLEPAEFYSADHDRIFDLLTALANLGGLVRNEIALTLGEIGGGEAAIFLGDALRCEIKFGSRDEDYQVHLASAISNIGGPYAVKDLLWAAKKGSERVQLAALSGIESLATVGSVALTEYPEPVTIDSEAMREACIEVAARLRALATARDAPSYVRYKAGELLDTILISLNSAKF